MSQQRESSVKHRRADEVNLPRGSAPPRPTPAARAVPAVGEDLAGSTRVLGGVGRHGPFGRPRAAYTVCLGTTLTAGGFAWVPRALRGLLWRVMRKGAVRGDLAADRDPSRRLRNVALAHTCESYKTQRRRF